MQALRYEADDLGAELRSYLSGIEEEPGRLEHVEERLALFARLSRKHGGTIADVLAHAQRSRERRDQLVHADVALEDAARELEIARGDLERLAAELSASRREAAPRLAEQVRRVLAELAMADASFEVDVGDRAEGCGPRGADSVEFRMAPNAGLPGGPLRDVASGGELSRVMLALLSVAYGGGGGDGLGLLVFDEIDAGIGGHTARVVGEHLRELANARQLLCITHLPQVAALGERHFTIAKDSSRSPARTTVTTLDHDEIVGELVRMLGADADDRAARGHARELIKAA